MTCKELWDNNQHEPYELWKNSIRFTYGVLNKIELESKKPIKKKDFKQFEQWQKQRKK